MTPRMYIPLIISIQLFGLGCTTTQEKNLVEIGLESKALDQRLALARQYIGDRNWPDAKRNLRLATEISPKDSQVYEVYALLHQSTGELDLAEDYFKEAIAIQPTFSRARNNYAAFLYSLGRFEEARKQLILVIDDALYSARPHAFINLGMCELRLGNVTEAKNSFKKTLLMEPRNSIAHVELGYLALDSGDLALAGQHYDRQRDIVGRQSSRALWLGIQLARKQNDRDMEGSLSLLLENLYPNSLEYQLYAKDGQ